MTIPASATSWPVLVRPMSYGILKGMLPSGPAPNAKSSPGGDLEPFVEPPLRTEHVVEALTVAILRGDFRQGDRLVERDLAARLRVSKTPVREALKILAHRGLIVSSSYRGAEVAAVDMPFAWEVYETRLLLEPAAVAKAVAAHSERSIAVASRALDDAAKAARNDDMAAQSLANRRFHQALYAPCPNVLLRSMTDDLQERVALITVAGWRKKSTWATEAEEHRSILEAVEKGEAKRAQREVKAHIGGFLRGLETDPPIPGAEH